MDRRRTSYETSKYAGVGPQRVGGKANRKLRYLGGQAGARYVARLPRLGASGVMVAIAVSALLTGFAGRAAADDAGWGAPVPVETGVAGNASQADIAVDPQGNAIAAWVQDLGNRSDIWANRFVSGSGWGLPTAIEVGDYELNIGPEVAVDAEGRGLVVWDHCPSPPKYNCTSIHAARFDPITGWGLPTTIATSSAGQGSLYVRDPAVDGSGTSTVVWSDSIGGVWATRGALGGSWEAPTQIGSGVSPSLAVSLDGTAIAAWRVSYEYSPGVMASRFVPGQGWGSPVLVNPNNQANATWGGPEVAENAAGVAFVVWNQRSSPSSPQTDAWAARFVPGAGWGNPTLVGKDTASFGPEVTVDPSGNAIATWVRAIWDRPGMDLVANRYLNGLGWGTAITIAPLKATEMGPGEFAIAGDSSGDALVVFADRGGLINATRWVPGLGWTTPSQVGSGGSHEFGTGHGPAIAANAQGVAFAVWTWYDFPSNARSIRASRYAAPYLAPSPPDLVVSSPAAPLTNNPNVTVSGTTRPGAAVAVDGTQVPVDPAGAFSYSTTLPDGPHTFVVVAYGASGSTITKSITVVVDTRAPALTLIGPGDGVTTFNSTIEVSGTTEPGMRLVVNGFLAAVAPDGTFSLRVGLPNGRNTIVVTATDAAGNVAKASATVTYLKPPGQDLTPLVQDLALLRSVAIASSAGVLALASLFLALYWTGWMRRPDVSGESQRSSHPEDSNSLSSQEVEVQPRTNGTGAPLPAVGIDRRWPARAISGPVRLTAKERILLHLLHFARYADASEVPRELTQERIVEAAGIDRRHFTQYVRPLVRDGFVRERMAHVRGTVQRRRAYVITGQGRNRALGVRDRIRSAAVRVRDAAGVREVTVAEALLEARGSMSVLDILRES